MHSFNSQNHPKNSIIRRGDVSDVFGTVDKWLGILQKLWRYLYLPHKTIRFVDLDETLLVRWLELESDDGIRSLRWESMYPYIWTKNGDLPDI